MCDSLREFRTETDSLGVVEVPAHKLWEQTQRSLEALGVVLRLEFRKSRNFLLAAGAPGGPKVEQHNLSPIVLERNRTALYL